ncbi:MAG TPA: hypothetical protein VN862_10315 [Candidatus Acidoferrales bacterium]|nr:hypothetical protein [Candidatus Acidoferrales bacterium]
MSERIVTIVVLSLFVDLGTTVVALSFIILSRGKLYQRLSPEARPTRWVVISLLVLGAIFIIWFPVWMTWPHPLISRLLTSLFAIAFVTVGLALKWLSGFVDMCIKRKGWPLR